MQGLCSASSWGSCPTVPYGELRLCFLVPPASPRAENEALCDRTVGWFPLATVVGGAGILPFVSFPFRTKKERGRGCRRPFIAVV